MVMVITGKGSTVDKQYEKDFENGFTLSTIKLMSDIKENRKDRFDNKFAFVDFEKDSETTLRVYGIIEIILLIILIAVIIMIGMMLYKKYRWLNYRYSEFERFIFIGKCNIRISISYHMENE